jgi:hypothetical protein
MRARSAFVVLSWVPFAVVQACGGDDSIGPGPLDGSTDATVDSTARSDSAPPGDGSTADSGTPDTSVADASDGSPPPPINYACGDASVTDCTMCTGMTQPCLYCSTDASTTTGLCTTFHTNCFNSLPSGFQDCPCMGDAAVCPASYQVCYVTKGGGTCHTCSDQSGNNMLVCESGGTCNYADGGCY